MIHPAVRSLYKELLHAVKEYPGGMEVARKKLKGAFFANARVNVEDRAQLEKSLAKGRYVLGELEALRRLHKYRYSVMKYSTIHLGQKVVLAVPAVMVTVRFYGSWPNVFIFIFLC